MNICHLLLSLLFVASPLFAAEPPGLKKTPLLPGDQWHVHDSDRPAPPVVTPGQDGAPPSDAVVLFDGKDLSHWRDLKGKPAPWKIENGYAEVRGGNIVTADEFGDCQLHLEWAAPLMTDKTGQQRANSGVFLFGKFEVQILDSFKSATYTDGQAAALYGQYPPLVNACRPPTEWQTYDIIFTAPRFKDGQLESPAYVTVIHNGIVVHNHTAFLGLSGHKSLPRYTPLPPKGPIMLQDHGNPMRFRNIWIRELKGYDQK